MESNTAHALRRPWGIHSEWRQSSKWTEPGAVRSDQELHFKDKLSSEQPLLLTYLINHEPHNLVIQEGNLQLYDRTGQSRALSRGKSQQCSWSLTSDLDGTEARGMDITDRYTVFWDYTLPLDAAGQQNFIWSVLGRGKACTCSWPV